MTYREIKKADDSIDTMYVKRIAADGTISFIPNDEENRDWKAYQAWLADGNEIEPAE